MHTCASACMMDFYQRISLSLDVLSSKFARQKEHWGLVCVTDDLHLGSADSGYFRF